MSNSGEVQEAIKVILGRVKEPYVTVWFRGYVFDNGCTISAFRQPKVPPKTLKSLDLSDVHELLTKILLKKQLNDVQQSGKPWTCITITAKADGIESFDLRYEDPETIDIYQLTTEWMKTDMAGLQFIPDKR